MQRLWGRREPSESEELKACLGLSSEHQVIRAEGSGDLEGGSSFSVALELVLTPLPQQKLCPACGRISESVYPVFCQEGAGWPSVQNGPAPLVLIVMGRSE